MTAPPSPILRDCIDQFARRLAEEMHRRELALRQSIEQKLVGERAPERRKLLTLADERMGKHWGDFCRTLYDALSRKALARAGYIEEDDADVASSVSSLRLVDDDQMEWDLSLGGVGSRLRGAGGKPLGQIEGRVAALLKKQLDDDDFYNPIGPESLVFALKKAIEVMAPETDLRRTVLLAIEPTFTECVVVEFEAANGLLADSGVEGVVRPKIISASASRAAGSPGGASGAPGSAAGGSAMSGDMLAVLQQLVQNSAGGAITGGAVGATSNFMGTAGAAMGSMAPGAGFGGMPPGMIAVPAAMLESLNRLQSLDLSALQVGTGVEGGMVNVLRDVRQQEFVRSLPPIEAVTIDIVATLFDFIFDDALVPDSVKALVGRLQIPLLKVAMLDKSFFSNKEHPARALLNEVSRASIAAGKDIGQGNPVFERIKAAVNRVLNEFEQDQSVFETLLPDLKALVAEQEEQAVRLAEQSKQVAEQQEQNELAELRAGEVFSKILEQGLDQQVPAHLANFLARRYPLILQRALLNGGTQGAQWSIATRTLSDLLWSLAPKPTSADRQKMVGMLSDLLRRLNAFLDKVGVPADEKSAFIDALAQHHSTVIKGVRKTPEKRKVQASGNEPEVRTEVTNEFNLPAAEIVSSGSMAPTVVVTRVVQENGVEVESMTVTGKTPTSRPIRNAEVGALKRGDWVEFIEEDGTPVRARLSWVSPYRGVMLFANPHSSKAISISQEALAIQVKDGKARLLADDTMVDRALGKALDSLKAA
jgi:hypothetical protein